MGQRLAVWVMAFEVGFDFDTRETVLVDRKQGDLIFGELVENRNRFEPTGTAALTLEALDLLVGDAHQVLEAIEGILPVRHFFRGDLERVDRTVLGKENTVAVVDQAAVRATGTILIRLSFERVW